MTLFTLLMVAAAGSSTSAASPAADKTPVVASSEVPELCNDPVYLVVWVNHLDRSKSKAYGEGLRSTGIVRRHGGKYLAVSPPVQMLEGSWPTDRGFVLEQYPCIDAVRKMWFSKEYQEKLKPLRAGSGDYTVAIMKAFKPAAATAATSIRP